MNPQLQDLENFAAHNGLTFRRSGAKHYYFLNKKGVRCSFIYELETWHELLNSGAITREIQW